MRGVSASLAEQNLAAGAHIRAGLGGTLVGSSLETDHGLAGLQHFIGEITLALIRRLGAKVRAVPLGMPVGLRKKKVHQSSRYCCAKSVSPLGLYRITWPWIFMKTEVTVHVGRKSWLNLAKLQLRIPNYQANSVNTLLRSSALHVLVCLFYKDINRKL